MTGLANRHESTPAYPKVSLPPPPMGTSNARHARKKAALRGMCAFVIQVAKPVPLFLRDAIRVKQRSLRCKHFLTLMLSRSVCVGEC